MEQQQLLHFCDSNHPLVFDPDYRWGAPCCGCQESVYDPSYYCRECGPIRGWLPYRHHKSCAELPLGLHHPLHPIHPLILSPEQIDYGKDIQFSNCKLCNEFRNQYTYRCSRCDFNLHITCASLLPTLEAEAELHDHPLTRIWKWITFTCDFCGKEDKGMPFLCTTCGFWIHRTCAYQYPRRVKVVRHKHLLHLTHSSLEFHQPDPRFCQLCVQKLDTSYGLYYCSKCDFVAHLDCAIFKENRENIDLQKFEDEDINLLEFKDEDEVPELDESVDSATYTVKESKVGKDGTEIATEIIHFSHVHNLKLTNEVLNNKKCYGCIRAILSPFYGCAMCGFFLHESCAKLPKIIRNPLHQHQLTLSPKPLYNSYFKTRPFYNSYYNTISLRPQSLLRTPYFARFDYASISPLHHTEIMIKDVIVGCYACKRSCNGFNYVCEKCKFSLDVPCSLIPEILNHHGHAHPLILSSIGSKENCSCCDSNISPIFRCTICAFALDFKCAALPTPTSYRKHKHLFTLCYTAEDDSDEYYCDICEEKRERKHWFYYCTDCSYPAHPKCVLGESPNVNTDSDHLVSFTRRVRLI